MITCSLGWSTFTNTWVHNGSGLSYDSGDFSDGWIEAAPVPLPASAPLFGGVVGLLATWHRRSGRRA